MVLNISDGNRQREGSLRDVDTILRYLHPYFLFICLFNLSILATNSFAPIRLLPLLLTRMLEAGMTSQFTTETQRTQRTGMFSLAGRRRPGKGAIAFGESCFGALPTGSITPVVPKNSAQRAASFCLIAVSRSGKKRVRSVLSVSLW